MGERGGRSQVERIDDCGGGRSDNEERVDRAGHEPDKHCREPREVMVSGWRVSGTQGGEVKKLGEGVMSVHA